MARLWRSLNSVKKKKKKSIRLQPLMSNVLKSRRKEHPGRFSAAIPEGYGSIWRRRRVWTVFGVPLRAQHTSSFPLDRLAGLVVKASASRAEDPGFESRWRRDFSGSSHSGDLKIGTLVATLPGAWRYRVSTGTGPPGVSILWLGEVESLVCNFYLSEAACKIVFANPSRRYTSMLLGR